MECFNTTGFISQLPILGGNKVVNISSMLNSYCFAGGVNVGMSKAYQDIINRLHEEQVKTV